MHIDMDYLVYKTTLDKKQMISKVNMGWGRFEVQLLNEFANGIDVSELAALAELHLPDVVSVHTPLGDLPNGSVDVYDFESDRVLDALKYTCKLANILASWYGHKIYVVLHSSLHREEISDSSNKFLKAMYELSNILYEYSSIELCIENVMPFSFSGKSGRRFYNGSMVDVKYFVDSLRESLPNKVSSRVNTLCDFTHLISYCRVLESIGASEEGELHEQFKAASESPIIHFANCIGNGIHCKDHGVGFTEDNKLLRLYIDIIERYWNIDANIVLEIQEEDYTVCSSTLKTLEVMKKVLEEYYGKKKS